MGYAHRGFRGYLSGMGAISVSGPIRATQFRATADGTATSYAFTWDADENMGLRRMGGDSFNVGVAGNTVLNIQQFTAGFGEGINNSGGYLSLAIITPTALAGTVHDYTPASWNGARGWVRQDATAASTITGLAATVGGHTAALWNISTTLANTITLKHENVGSVAANRFHLPNLADYVLSACEGIMMIYDGTSARWRLIGTS
jgi:hypothetical protein